MDDEMLKITPNRERAISMLKMAEATIEMVKKIDKKMFPSNVLKEYYDIIRELMGIILLLDGYKIIGEGSHKKLIEYIKQKCQDFEANEIMLIDELRVARNKISYEGFFIDEEYLNRKQSDIETIISKLKALINKKLRPYLRS